MTATSRGRREPRLQRIRARGRLRSRTRLSDWEVVAAADKHVAYQRLAVRWMAAAMDGATIELVNGCVTANGTTTLFFPREQVEPATAPAVLRWLGHDYRDGSTIDLGGGFGGPAVGLPSACPTDTWAASPSR